MAERRNWSREEIILAFELYCRTPYGRISSTNKDIIKLAAMLGRTPGAVALKMSNLASCDPTHQKRQVRGMTHINKLDSVVFNKYYQNLESLSSDALDISRTYLVDDADNQQFYDEDSLPIGRYREDQKAKVRLGQDAFRKAVLASYENKCCVTGLGQPELLIASHIKPWAVCDEGTERTNPRNGLCLNALHDRAFDSGLITIDKTLHIVISSQLKTQLTKCTSPEEARTKKWLLSFEGDKIRSPKGFCPSLEFIEYHNQMVFKG